MEKQQDGVDTEKRGVIFDEKKEEQTDRGKEELKWVMVVAMVLI